MINVPGRELIHARPITQPGGCEGATITMDAHQAAALARQNKRIGRGQMARKLRNSLGFLDITPAQLVAAVREIAAEWPDAVYELADGEKCCMYSNGLISDGPEDCGCIIGQAITRLVPDADLFGLDIVLESREGQCGPVEIFGDFWEGHDQGQHNCVRWLDLVQQSQDGGHSWSRAVDIADHTATAAHGPLLKNKMAV